MTDKIILKKASGIITISAFNAGDKIARISAFDIYIQIIDGMATLTINEKKFQLKMGEGIIIPAHSSHIFNAEENFKMISTVLKSGYENARPLFLNV